MNKIVLTILLCCVSLLGCFPSSSLTTEEVLIQGRTMGTTYNVKVVVTPENIDIEQLSQDIDAALIDVNQSMSTYIADSELSQINNNHTIAPIKLSKPLATVIAESIRLGQLSSGKLDVTVGPLVNLWGFGPQYQIEKSPSNHQLKEAQSRVGISHLKLSEGKLSKKIPELSIDLSTIAKGYGVDVIAQLLESTGINNYLVEIGGEMRLKGFKRTGELWHVAIEKPITKERSVHQVIVPKNNAVATSGDYRNYYEVEGQRYSHIIDPDTAAPINHKLVSVTVIHPSAMTADGLSTALMVMGEEKALAFAEQHGIAAYIISKTENGFVEQTTVKFMQYLK